VIGEHPPGAALGWAGELAGQPAQQRDAECCKQHQFSCSLGFHTVRLVLILLKQLEGERIVLSSVKLVECGLKDRLILGRDGEEGHGRTKL